MSTSSKNRGSTESQKPPYLRLKFWLSNAFWESDIHTQASKEYHRQRIREMFEQKKNMATL